MRSILVIVAHPDDEVLGCGGAIAKHVSQGDEVNLVIMSDGVKSRSKYSKEELKNLLIYRRKIKKGKSLTTRWKIYQLPKIFW